MYKTSLFTPPAEHPRLFLSKVHLPELKNKMQASELSTLWQRIEFFSQYEEVRVNDHDSPEVAYVIEANALMYLLKKDTEAGEKAKRLVMQNITQGFNLKYQDISREIGRLMLAGAMFYDWCHDFISESEKRFLIGHFKRLAKLLECGYPPIHEGAFVGHSNEWMIMRDMIGTGIAIYDEDSEMYDWAAGRFFETFIPARNFFYPSGWHHQGSGYGQVRFEAELFPTWLFDRMGYGNVYDSSQEEVGYQWIYLRRPDGKLLRDGDAVPPSTGVKAFPRIHFLYLMLGSYYQNSYFKDQWLNERAAIKDSDVTFAFLFADTKLQPSSISNLPLTRYFDKPAGIMIARTGWDTTYREDSSTVVALMKIGLYQYNNHQHLDAGSFQIYYKGLLAIDSGSYKGSSGKYHSPHNKYYSKRSIAHNTMLIHDPDELKRHPYIRDGGLIWPNVNEGGQLWPNDGVPPLALEDFANEKFKQGDVEGHGIGPDQSQPRYSYLKGDLSLAYREKVREYKRSFVFVNLNSKIYPALLIVFDKVESLNPNFTKHWLLHSVEEPLIKDNRTVIERHDDENNGQLINDTLLPVEDNCDIRKIGGSGKEFQVFGTNYVNDFPNSKEQGAWRVEVSPDDQASETNLFLNVMQIKDIDKKGAPRAKTVESEWFIGTRIHEWTVLFSKSGNRLKENVSVDLGKGHSKDQTKCLFTDLNKGFWRIKQENGTVFIKEVSEESGVLYVEGLFGLVYLTYC